MTCLVSTLTHSLNTVPFITRVSRVLVLAQQGRTEEFGEGGVQYEFDEGAGQEVTLPRGLGLNPRIFCITRSVIIEKIY